VTATDVSLGEVRALTPVERRAVISHNSQYSVCSDISTVLDTSALYLSSQDHKLYKIFTGFSLFSLFWYGSTAIYSELINKWFSKSRITLHSQQHFYVIEFFKGLTM